MLVHGPSQTSQALRRAGTLSRAYVLLLPPNAVADKQPLARNAQPQHRPSNSATQIQLVCHGLHARTCPFVGVSKTHSGRIEQLLKAIKRPFSFRIKKLLEQSGSTLLAKLTIRQRAGVETFRFWQEGPGYDRNLIEASTIEAAIDYIHRNPVRRGLCQSAVDWRWSSARFYYENRQDSGLPSMERVSADLLNMPQ